MPATITERAQSRPFDISSKTASLTRTFCIAGTQDEDEVKLLIFASTPAFIGFLVRDEVKVDPMGGGIWFADVSYKTIDQGSATGVDPVPPTQPDGGTNLDSSFSFDTTGSTLNLKQSRSTRSMTTATGAATPDNKNLIGVTFDSVEGVDVFSPKFEWTRTVARVNCNGSYLGVLAGLTGTVNYGSDFYGFPAGTLLYLGASGQYTQTERWSITHKFSYQPNQTSIVVGDITIPAKKGWDYIWFAYRTAKIAVRNTMAQVPDAAYVEVVYPTGDFSLIDIG